MSTLFVAHAPAFPQCCILLRPMCNIETCEYGPGVKGGYMYMYVIGQVN